MQRHQCRFQNDAERDCVLHPKKLEIYGEDYSDSNFLRNWHASVYMKMGITECLEKQPEVRLRKPFELALEDESEQK